MQFLNELRLKYSKLMYDRHGIDSLSKDMIFIWLVISLLNTLFRSRIAALVALLLLLIAILRMFSRETYKRSKENLKYLNIKRKTVDFSKIQLRKIKEFKTHRYCKCKNCSSYLRVKRKKGTHTVCCPKCGKEFKVKIIYGLS